MTISASIDNRRQTESTSFVYRSGLLKQPFSWGMMPLHSSYLRRTPAHSAVSAAYRYPHKKAVGRCPGLLFGYVGLRRCRERSLETFIYHPDGVGSLPKFWSMARKAYFGIVNRSEMTGKNRSMVTS